MLPQLSHVLQQECQFEGQKPLLVGVSGGPDSLVLLDALNCLAVPLLVAHFDHHLRPTSGEDARLVQAAAASRGLACLLGEEDVGAYARAHHLSVEEAARTLRYRFLFDQAQRHDAAAVAVAHTADDQVETVLMHLLRGAGLAGLRGMPYRSLPNPWSETLPLIRPLLGTWRAQIVAYCAGRNLQPVLDASNLDQAFFRNRLRHELLPFLETYNPQVRQRVWQTAHLLSADYAALEQQAAAAWEACRLEQGPGYLALDSHALLAQPLALQRMLLRRALGTLRPGLRDIEFEAAAQALDFAAHPTRSGQRDLVAGLRLLWEEKKVWIATWQADLPGGEYPQVDRGPLALPFPGEAALLQGWRLSAEEVEPSRALDLAHHNADPFEAWACVDEIDRPLAVRTARPGERFRPLGMGGHSLKLADFWVNQKLPRRARAGWPLVCAGDAILWLPGFRLAHPYRLTAESRRAVHLRLWREMHI